MTDSSTTASPVKTGKKGLLRKRIGRFLLWFFIVIIALVLALAGGAWWWISQPQSLAQIIQLAQRYLPAGQQLQASDVNGSLRAGGHIGQLRYSTPAITVDVDNATIGWSLDKVWDRDLQFGTVHIARLTLTPSGVEQPKEPTQPLEQLTLPLHKLVVPFGVDEIVWAAEQPVTVSGLQGRYEYSASQHQLQIAQVQAFNGNYQAQITLGGLAPMPLTAELQAHIDQPASEQLPAMQADAKASVTGDLAGADASLRVQAQVNPRIDAAAPATDKKPSATQQQSAQALAKAPPMQADVDATVYPWKPWPLGPTQATLQSINLGAFMPQLPTTLLNGKIAVAEAKADALAQAQAAHAVPTLAPPADGAAPAPALLPVPLDIAVDITNALPGPINQQRLPVTVVTVNALFDGQRADVLSGSSVQLGDGRLQAEGAYRLADHHLAVQAVLSAINPALADTRLDSAPLSGTVQATSAQDAIDFDVNIRATHALVAQKAKKPAAKGSISLPIDRIEAKGRWQAPVLQLSTLQIDALKAHISGQKMAANTEQMSGEGQLNAQLPGATLDVQANAAPTKGDGNINLKLASAEQLLQWLRTLPFAGNALPPGLAAQGSANASLRFSGGYADALRQLHQAGLLAKLPGNLPSKGAQAFTVDALVSTPALTVRTGPDAADAWQLRDTRASVKGSLSQLQAELRTEAKHGEQTMGGDLAINASASGANQWKATVSRLQAAATLPPQQRNWKAALQQPLELTVRLPGTNQAPLQVSTGAGQLQVSGPEAGNAKIAWQPLQLSLANGQGMQLQSIGTVQGLPLRWVRAFQSKEAQAQPNNTLDSDLVLQGQWNVALANSLKANVVLERASGDLRLHAQASELKNVTLHSSGKPGSIAKAFSDEGSTINAGIRTMRVEVTAQDHDVRADVRWDTNNAGTLAAQLQTQLQYPGTDVSQATVAPDAPLSGTIKANMPDLGVWANFAPPGWRVAGSLNADVSLAGTLRDPRWTGTLGADKMRIQSQLDGVDLHNGTMRARLQGNELVLQNLHFEGGEGSRARIIGFSGNLTEAPTHGGTLDATGTIRWTMPSDGGKPDIHMDIRTQAKALQVLVRADRQVSISGDVRSQLQQGQLSVTGDVRVDRATIVLANESAPTLGSDVVVHTKASRAAAAAKAKKLAEDAAANKLEPAGGIVPAKPMLLDIKLNMGRDFALQGYGITTRLRGSLQIQNSGAGIGTPRITGVIRTEEGRYRAWGQVLNVETGLIRFNGPYNNPSLDITALRPNITVKAGVQVTGSAMAPRVKLYSDPEMPDAEKLSWVVMGRDPAGGGANSALMQQAAMALIGGGSGESITGNIAKGLGLDEIGFNGGGDGAGAGLSFGKRLSKDLYVTYERSLAGALGVFYIFYDITRNLQLRGSAGTTNALDLIYTLRYD